MVLGSVWGLLLGAVSPRCPFVLQGNLHQEQQGSAGRHLRGLLGCWLAWLLTEQPSELQLEH